MKANIPISRCKICIYSDITKYLSSPAWTLEINALGFTDSRASSLRPSSLLTLPFSIKSPPAQEDKSMSWLASGEGTASFEIESSGFTLTLDGTHQEIAFFQDRSPFTNLFTGLHLIVGYSGKEPTTVGTSMCWATKTSAPSSHWAMIGI